MPKLQIVPVDALMRHEWHDIHRSKPLIESLQASGVLRNPPIVTPLGDDSGNFMILDGTNRAMALKQMEIPHCICQIVDAEDEGLRLRTWNHVVWGMDPKEIINRMEKLDGISLESVNPGNDLEQDWPQNTLVWMQGPNGNAHTAQTKALELADRVKMLCAIADSYRFESEIDRTRANQVSEIKGIFDSLSGLVVYPPFSIGEVLELCQQGIMFPPGITRFTISPRALRINYSLNELVANQDLDEKNRALEKWQSERVARKGVRFYAEASVLYDE